VSGDQQHFASSQLSPAAHRLSEINGFFRDGKIDAERKSQMKNEVLRE
jgi:hypothetical protein